MVLKKYFIDRTSIKLLRESLVCGLRIEELVALHQELENQFEEMQFNHSLIGSIFENYAAKLLIYCRVFAKLKIIMKLIEDQIAYNPEFRQEVEDLEIYYQKSTRKHNTLTADLIPMILGQTMIEVFMNAY